MAVGLVGLSRGACLANTTFAALNFNPVSPYTPPTNNTFCTTALQGAQSCVNLTQIVAITNAQKTAVLGWETANFTTALSNATSAVSDFKNLCTSSLTTANLGKKLNNVTITQSMLDGCNNLSSISSGAILSVSNLTSQFANCTNMVATIINGAYCLFTSSNASTFVTSNGNSLQLTASTDVPNAVVTQCATPLYTVCYLNSVSAFLDQFTGNTTANATITGACGNINTMFNCTSNSTACSTSASTLFTQFFTPTGSRIGASISRTFGASISTVRSYAVTTRRLLMAQTSNVTSTYQVSSTGFNVATSSTGLNTTNGTTPNGAAIYGLGFLLMLVALVLN